MTKYSTQQLIEIAESYALMYEKLEAMREVAETTLTWLDGAVVNLRAAKHDKADLYSARADVARERLEEIING